MKRKILITYAHFLPAYKAGGPIQSIANLCRQMAGEYDFYIACSDRDMHENKPLSGIKSNEWNDFENGTAKVYYISKERQNISTFKKIIKEVDPDVVYTNGVFLPLFSIVPLMLTNGRRIISVRGMLHPGAMAIRSLKKNVFITLCKILGLHKKTIFHVTNDDEKTFTQNIFGKHTSVIIAQNFPRLPQKIKIIEKDVNELKLVSISLITPKKNHAAQLEALKSVKSTVYYDIYGPIVDKACWDKCQKIIDGLPSNIIVNYKGEIEPSLVPEILSDYHCYTLPSTAENFGHAIYEALLVGKPVVTSYFTPWNNLTQNQAGWNVDITDISTISNAIEQASAMDDNTYQQWSDSTMEYAKKSIDFDLVKQQYRELFNE